MARYDRFHIWHTAIGEFERIPVENASKFVLWWEAFAHNFEVFLADVRNYTVTVWRVEPDYLS